jgi:branched-chain amino acid transport system substrate-binding protein
VGEGGVQYAGPATAAINSQELKIAVFGQNADRAVHASEIAQLANDLDASGRHFTLIAISTEGSWGKASTALVQAVYQDQVLGIIALDRNSSHLAEQIGVKAFVPVIAISSDKMLTSSNIPWIFRLPEGTALSQAVQVLAEAVKASGANRGKVREFLASGTSVGGIRFEPTGEIQ